MYKIIIKKFRKIASKESTNLLNAIKNIFRNLDKKIIKILKYGLIFCSILAIVAFFILSTYLFFVHSQMIYEIGILLFQISLYYTIYFIASAITIDSLRRNLI